MMRETTITAGLSAGTHGLRAGQWVELDLACSPLRDRKRAPYELVEGILAEQAKAAE